MSLVFAADPTPTPLPSVINPCPNTFPFLCFGAEQSGTFIGNAFNLAIIGAVLIATAYLIYGGIKWVMSKGDKTEVESARNHIVAAIIGLIIVFLAFFIINIILKIFGLSGGFTIPKIVP